MLISEVEDMLDSTILLNNNLKTLDIHFLP